MNTMITGTGSGIGYELAKYLLEEGHNVYAISRTARQELVVSENFHFLKTDLSEPEILQKQLPPFLAGIDILDLVVLNAGILPAINDLKDTSLQEIKRVMDTNVWSNKILIDVIFETVDRVKQVVAISSGAAVSGSRGWNAYSLSKCTLNMLISLYSKEHPRTHFSALAPGLVDTAMQDYISGLPTDAEEKFPVVNTLKKAKGTSQMPKPKDVTGLLTSAFNKALTYKTGSFIDLRELYYHQ